MYKVSEYKKQFSHFVQYYIVEFFHFIPVFPRTIALFSPDPEVVLEKYIKPYYLMSAWGKGKAIMNAMVLEYEGKIMHLKEYSKNLEEDKVKLPVCIYNTNRIINLLVDWGPSTWRFMPEKRPLVSPAKGFRLVIANEVNFKK
jgi:hypothetical protein